MRTAIRVVDPVDAHRLWAVVAAGVPRRGGGHRRRRPRGLQQLQGGLRRQRATDGSTPWRPSPPRFPAAGTASSGTGTSPTRTTRGCGRGPRSPRCCWTASPCPTKCCGRAVSGSGWPRSVTRTNTCAGHACVRDPLHHPRRPRPRQHRRRQAFAASTGEPPKSTSAFFWNVIAPAWNSRIERADISITLPGDVAACSARSATASAGSAAT